MYVKYLNGLDTPGSENAWISEVKKVTGFDYRNKRHKMKKKMFNENPSRGKGDVEQTRNSRVNPMAFN